MHCWKIPEGLHRYSSCSSPSSSNDLARRASRRASVLSGVGPLGGDILGMRLYHRDHPAECGSHARRRVDRRGATAQQGSLGCHDSDGCREAISDHGGFVSCRLGVDQCFSLLAGGPCSVFRGGLSKLGGRTLGLLDCDTFQETFDLAVDSAPLGG